MKIIKILKCKFLDRYDYVKDGYFVKSKLSFGHCSICKKSIEIKYSSESLLRMVRDGFFKSEEKRHKLSQNFLDGILKKG